MDDPDAESMRIEDRNLKRCERCLRDLMVVYIVGYEYGQDLCDDCAANLEEERMVSQGLIDTQEERTDID